MERGSFLHRDHPTLVSMLQAKTPERIEELMQVSLMEGAEAFGMQFCKMEKQYRNKETYQRLFDLAAPFPVYVTNYRKGQNAGKGDDMLAEELLELAECGAVLCDVMGDYFDPCPDELTMNEAAVQKQKKLIDELHARGAEVLMSSHLYHFTAAERVLEIAMEHQRRGADICKIVTGADDMDQQVENLRIIRLLKKELEIPFLFLAGGECRILRRIGGELGCCMYLCVHEYDELATKSQPLLAQMKMLRGSGIK